ncbi:zinc-dependent alcohol dehydrogenase family protein [Halococcoides cellulosivorans]|uniref:IMP dehydrogenase n=1 Tax=Halococcoides cellulosivorans TaxID=1679096 RepID=A0A2R4WZ96_9EURY|nr:zinc-dependent alcohol dehydrogenase family protein [Halococcoides cellulosivorans]AWB26856.1 IMP dehydrogenase [Halococcoides cellulosivorans]
MRATVFHGPGDVRVEEVDRPELTGPDDAIVRITHTAICGSDLWFYRGDSDRETPSRVGHEPMGIVEATGEDVRRVREGDRVFAPFAIGCGECQYCRAGLPTSCEHGESWSDHGGAQSEYVRVPHADGTLVRVPDRYADDERALEALLPLTDVMGTGHHAARSAGVDVGSECVVIGDGAVGLCGVLAARRLGAKRIVAVGHHEDRLALAEAFGADATVDGSTREDPIERVKELTHGGVDHAVECVGAASAMETAVGVCRPGGTVGYVGVPHGMDGGFPIFEFFTDNVTLQGGVAPVREYADDLMADVLGGTLDPSPIFTKTVPLDDIAEGYRAMDEREAIKVLVRV